MSRYLEAYDLAALRKGLEAVRRTGWLTETLKLHSALLGKK